MVFDLLNQRIKELKTPICVGLDTDYSYIPEYFRTELNENDPFLTISEDILKFNKAIIDEIDDVVPAVKLQIAYYEKYGYLGLKAYKETIDYAKMRGLIVICDAKRNDIGSTAAAYSAAFLSGVEAAGKIHHAFDADILTVNPYLGTDGIKPFLDDMVHTSKGIFVLVKTSNPSSGEFQDKESDGKSMYLHVADLVESWGEPFIGKSGYSKVGAVVGATYTEQLSEIRDNYPNIFLLIPGYGAQGAGGNDVAAAFDKSGGGAVVNSSRGILLAYKKPEYHTLSFELAARAAVIDMKKDLESALEQADKK